MRSVPVAVFLVSSLALASCSRAPQPEAVRICDSGGCSDRPLTEENADLVLPASPETKARMAALEELAMDDPRAAHDLALRLFRGDGVPRNPYLALKWMRDAAGRNELEAQKAVGRFYLTGLEEMGPDPREAQKWLTMAAAAGDQESQALLDEALAARRSDEDYDRWTGRWRPVFYHSWHAGYRYHGYWGDDGWRY